jgi:hypothetical protein
MRSPLAPLTVLTLLLTVLTLRGNGPITSRGSKPAARYVQAQEGQENSDAASRHRHVMPNHWRAFLLHR